tara:strand:- start:310 stop:834 length:525 start_codon:yes stop_codon:yes gene_type:complete
MTVRANKPEFNIREKLKSLDYAHVPYEKMPAGSVIQYSYRAVGNVTFSTSSSSMTDITNFYVDITPRSATNLLVVSTNFTAALNDADGYGRYRIVDSNNGDTQWSSNTYMGSSHYYANHSTQQWLEVVLKHTYVAGTTNTMRLQFQVQINAGGTLDLQWSGGDDRIVEVFEVAQ